MPELGDELAYKDGLTYKVVLEMSCLVVSRGGVDQYVRAAIAFGIRYEEGGLAWIADLPGILAEPGEPAQN